MLDFEDLGQMLDGNLFFQVDGLVLNLDFWTIENISGMFQQWKLNQAKISRIKINNK